MKRFQKFVLVASALVSTVSLADDHKTLLMTLVNNTKTALTYTGVTGQNAGNVFSISAATIAPQSSAVITGKITQDTDLAGSLHFRDGDKNDNSLALIDPRNMHAMQPVFSMRNARMQSTLKTFKHGDMTLPKALLISESTVLIESVK
jgi:hypothetical protein